MLFRNLFAMDKLEVKGVRGIVISSVVPPLDSTLRQVCERYFNTKPLFIEPGVKTGMPVLYDNPAEVGADRIVNSVAAFEKYGGPCIVVDFGTATTFDCVSAKGEYQGGVICPGIGISADALFQNDRSPAARGHSQTGARDRHYHRRQSCSPGFTTAISDWWTAFSSGCSTKWGGKPPWSPPADWPR